MEMRLLQRAKPNLMTWLFLTGSSVALIILAAPIVSALQIATAGSYSATAKEEPGLSPVRGAYASVTAYDLTVPPSSPLATSTQVRLTMEPGSGGVAWASTGCAVNFNPPCQTEVMSTIRDVNGNGDGLQEWLYNACYSSSGCAPHPTGIGKAAYLAYDANSPLDMLVTIDHGLFGTNSETVTFEICAQANILIDSNGDGQWSGETPTYDYTSGNVCDQGTVRVSL